MVSSTHINAGFSRGARVPDTETFNLRGRREEWSFGVRFVRRYFHRVRPRIQTRRDRKCVGAPVSYIHACVSIYAPLASLSVFTRQSLRLSRRLASGSYWARNKSSLALPNLSIGTNGATRGRASAGWKASGNGRNCKKTSGMMNVERYVKLART